MSQPLCPAESPNSCPQGAGTWFFFCCGSPCPSSQVSGSPAPNIYLTSPDRTMSSRWRLSEHRCCKVKQLCALSDPKVEMCEFLLEQGVLVDILVEIEKMCFWSLWMFQALLISCVDLCSHFNPSPLPWFTNPRCLSTCFPPHTHNENKRKADSCVL